MVARQPLEGKIMARAMYCTHTCVRIQLYSSRFNSSKYYHQHLAIFKMVLILPLSQSVNIHIDITSGSENINETRCVKIQ